MTINGKEVGLRELLMVFGILAALYGGVQGIESIAKKEATTTVNEHVIEVEPVFDGIQRQLTEMKENDARIDERTQRTKEAVDRIEQKIDRIQ